MALKCELGTHSELLRTWKLECGKIYANVCLIKVFFSAVGYRSVANCRLAQRKRGTHWMTYSQHPQRNDAKVRQLQSGATKEFPKRDEINFIIFLWRKLRAIWNVLGNTLWALLYDSLTCTYPSNTLDYRVFKWFVLFKNVEQQKSNK